MTAIPDHYAALGIDPTADPEVIAAAYRALAKKYHPDTGATTGTASTERFEQVQRAYEVLRSPESRRQYDLELLAQTERDLAEHLARKRRALPGGAGSAPSLPNPDLGAIRPEPAAGARGRGPTAPATARRATAPYLIPAVLLLALAGTGAWLFLPGEPSTPPVSVATTAAPAVATPAAPPPPDASGSAPAAATAETAQLPDDTQEPGMKADAGATPAPSSTAVPASAMPEDESQPPLFGTSDAEGAQAEAAPAPPVPAPTPKPRPVKQAAVPAKPKTTTPPAAPRPQVEAAAGAYMLTIFERKRRGRIVTRQADMLFATRGSCVEFGVKAVLRRMEARNMNPRRQRVWYECEPAL